VNLDLSEAIYRKYYLEAKSRGIVWTAYDYAVKKGLYSGDDYDFNEEDIPELKEHGEAIKEVMACEIGLFVFRRLNGPWGEITDQMVRMRNRITNEYREKTGFQIETGNEDELW